MPSEKDPALLMSPLQELVERTNKIVFIYEPEENRFSYLNPAFEEVWHKTRESVQNNPAALMDAIHPEDREYVLQVFDELEVNASEKTIEFRIQVFNENVQWIRLTANRMTKRPEGTQVVGFMEDITVTKEHTKTMHKYAGRKNSILEILSHDLSGPLTTIRSLSTILRERIKDYNDETLDKMLKMIADTNERNIRLVREFVKQEFLESSNAALEVKRVNLVHVVGELIDQYKLSEKDIDKVFQLETSDERIFVEIDDLKFGQVLNNLISNSIKFTHEGGLISIKVKAGKDTVLVIVADDGIGIPEDLQDGLFEKFTKARRPGIKGEPSVGLGMSIIKTIVEWHAGRIWFESQENKGTTFYIELPRKPKKRAAGHHPL